jgi:myo-inositol-1(or 4)-monophosphatase
MQPTTSSIINATRKSAKFLQRDFSELEMLQNSNRGTGDFCKKSYLRTKEFLKEELQKHSKIIFFADEKYQLPTNDQVVILVSPIEGVENLAKSLPFFATAITYMKKIQDELSPVISVINFPILNQIYYAEKGNGTWIENNPAVYHKTTRLKASSCNNLEQALIATDNAAMGLKIANNIRISGSTLYNLILFSSGKIDIFHSEANNQTITTHCSLFIKESGGIVLQKSKNMLASNPNLIDKIKI